MTAAPRIVTVSLNPAIDQTASVADFTAGEVNRVAWEQSDAGGKGVNVASFLAHFGHRVAVTGLLGADNTELFLRLFAEKGLVDRFLRIAGRTRVNVKIVDDRRQAITDINFPGAPAGPEDLAAVTAVVEELAELGAEWFVLSGSLPAGLPSTCYRDLAQRVKSRRCRVVLDSSGPAFAEALAAGPDVVKPNIDELTELVGRALASDADVIAAARELHRHGVGLVAVSMGAKGALFVDGAHAIHAAPPPVTVKSTVGAGDAMVAGIVHGSLIGLGLEDCARLATAFSMGALGEIGPRLPPPQAIETYRTQVTTRNAA